MARATTATWSGRFGFIAGMALGMAGSVWAQQPPSAAGDIATAHRPSVPGRHGLVASANPLASMAGMRILLDGGNAIDAAVAVGTTLNVVEPMSSGIGGNGFMTMFEKKTGKVYSLGMTGAAPLSLDPNDMTAETLNEGIKAGIVPGNIGGWIVALDRLGTKSLGEVLAPAIDYAENGHPANDRFVSAVEGRKAFFERHPTSARVFLPDGRVPRVGEIVRMPDLARTLRRLVDAEAEALAAGQTRSAALMAAFDRFYRGDIADEFDRFFRDNGGILTRDDLARFEPIWAEPVHTTYRGYDVYSSPSTSRGGLEVVMQLNLIEGYDLAALGFASPESLHLVAEAIKVTKADIYEYVADPKFTRVPSTGLLSKEYAESRRSLIDSDRAIPYPASGDPSRFDRTEQARRGLGGTTRAPFGESVVAGYDTTSFSIVDGAGNAVGCTPTLGGGFGNGVVVGETGVLLNNGVRLGSTSPYSDNVNYVRGGQIPLLNNSPLVVLKDGRLKMVYGTPGGETIGQTQFQVLLNVIDFGMTIQEAIEAPRFRLEADPNFYKAGATVTMAIEGRVPGATIDALRARGHRIEVLPGYTAGVGGMQGIVIDLEHGTMTGGADPRRAGYVIGW